MQDAARDEDGTQTDPLFKALLQMPPCSYLPTSIHSDAVGEAVGDHSERDVLIDADDALHACASASPRRTCCDGDSGAPLAVGKNTLCLLRRLAGAPSEFRPVQDSCLMYAVPSFG